MHTVLIIGGYGFFGQRIAATLATDRDTRVLVGGRHLERARSLCAALSLPIEHAVVIDAADAALPTRLTHLAVNTIIHTAGPFQDQDYRVARSAIAAHSNYIDLADARQFVVGIEALDAEAKRAGVSVISGASSVPALSAAVVDRYRGEFSRLEEIRIGISSGARTPGLATVRAVFGYCGKPISQLKDGEWSPTYGWQDLVRYRFVQPVGARWLGCCDVPDLDLLPEHVPAARTVTFHAGIADPAAQLFVWLLSGLVRIGIVPSLRSLAAPLHRVNRWLEPLGSDKSAMFVELEGIDHQLRALKKRWNLIALRHHGPYVPCGASIALAHKLARGDSVPRGAMACVGLLSVEEYLAPLRDLDIHEATP